MANIITTLHPENDADTNLYPNIKKENIPNKSIDVNKIGDDVLDMINSNQVKVNTTSYIEGLTSNQGVYVSSDNNKYYYWNGTQYVIGGDFFTGLTPSDYVFKKSGYNIVNQADSPEYSEVEDAIIHLTTDPFGGSGLRTSYIGTNDNRLNIKLKAGTYYMKYDAKSDGNFRTVGGWQLVTDIGTIYLTTSNRKVLSTSYQTNTISFVLNQDVTVYYMYTTLNSGTGDTNNVTTWYKNIMFSVKNENYIPYNPIGGYLIGNVLEFKTYEMMNYRYLTFSFGYRGSYGLFILGSNDLKQFKVLNPYHPFKPKNNLGVRDPAIIFINGYYYITYSPLNDAESVNHIGLVRTKDFINWEELPDLTIVCSNGDTFENGYCWAPDWFRKDDKIYICCGCSVTTSPQNFYLRIMEFNPDSNTIGEAYTTNIFGIDGHIYYENGYYYSLGSGGLMFKSQTLLSDQYERVYNTSLQFRQYEAQFGILKDNGKWRIFGQNVYGGDVTNGYIYYQDGDTLESEFTERKPITYDTDTKNFCASLWNTAIRYFSHFTIYDRNNWLSNNNNYDK